MPILVLPDALYSMVRFNMCTAPKGLQLTIKGPNYPSTTSSDLVPQSFALKLLCSTETSDPKLVSYDGKTANVEWSAPAGCDFVGPPSDGEPSGGDEKGGNEKESESVGSGIGYFFLL